MQEEPVKKPYTVKVYLVLQRNNLAKQGEPNERIIAAKLTAFAAGKVKEEIAGTRIVRVDATK